MTATDLQTHPRDLDVLVDQDSPTLDALTSAVEAHRPALIAPGGSPWFRFSAEPTQKCAGCDWVGASHSRHVAEQVMALVSVGAIPLTLVA
ncbi:hypothetical protein [Sanguibacter suaedae]|uniref:Uncharacterized protein n=1 Tax=Sanguibacter suaedae TaxID=2795737 RepID=A0A934M968_9MICO|nr:hypothetical protein [Sanguibacter suaedae]MBI9114328.1 hypothetical protein [Sanguibacter suaedae]